MRGAEEYGNGWTKKDPRLTKLLREEGKTVLRMTLQEKWHRLKSYYPYWWRVIQRHDSYEDHGARIIRRKDMKVHIPQGYDWWQLQAYDKACFKKGENA